MKLIVFFVFVFSLATYAESSAQKVTISMNNASFQEVAFSIQKQTGYSFVMNKKFLNKSFPVQMKGRDLSLEQALELLFKDQPFSYRVRGKIISLVENDKTAIVNQKNSENMITEQIMQSPLKGKVRTRNGELIAGAILYALNKDNKRITKKELLDVDKDKDVFVLTKANGEFAFSVPSTTQFLEVSMMGFQKRIVKIDNNIDYDIILNEASLDINEVVVTGLFERPAESFTGAATAVTGKQLRDVNAMNVFDALKVFDPAVRIPDNVEFGSDPNNLPNISLRGTNNFPTQGEGVSNQSGADFMAAYQSNPSMPLFMLDGFEVSLQKIYDLDINRIEKMTILKDAVATSAYGSRAANGVIVVETKQPQPGKLTVSYTSTLQVTAPDLTSYNLLNAADKLELERISGLYNTSSPETQLILNQRYAHRRSEVERGVDTYWLSQPLQTGVGTKQSIYVEGGDNHIRYGASAGYTNDKGVMKNSGRETFEGGMTLSYRKNNFLVRNQLNISNNSANNSPYGSFSNYSRLNPYWNPFDSNGNVNKILETITNGGVGGTTIIANPLYNATVGTLDRSTYTGINNNTFLEWRSDWGLKLTAKLGISSQKDESNLFLPADHTSFANIKDYDSDEYINRGSYNRSNSSFFNYDGGIVGDYSKVIGKSLIYATLGFSLAEQQSKSAAIVVRGFPNNRLDEIFYGNGYLENSRPSGQHNISRRLSSFANFNYTYDNRYLFDLALNLDGSTQFGELNRYAPFGAIGLGWNIHEESFMGNVLPYINRLKLRGGVGNTGSQQFPPFMAITTYTYNTGQDYLGMFGANMMGYGNSNLRWQETIKYNFGADMSIWQDRFIVRLDAYYELTDNLLLDINTPPSLGVSSYKENMGKLANKGIEGNINAFVFKPNESKFSWSLFLNAIHNRNEIKEISNALKKMNEANDSPDQNKQTRPQQRYEEGKSVNSIWAVQSAGIDPSTGREVYYDRDGNLTYIWNAADKVIVGDGFPKISGNLGTNLTYRGIQFGAYFSYQLGAKQYNQTLADYVENADVSMNVDERVFLDRWKQPGDLTFFKGLADINGNTVTTATNATSRFMQKNNFLNFTSISLGYILPDDLSKKLHLKNTRLTLQGNNILQLSTIQVERGMSYPFARNFTFSLNTSF